jgi:hypothetical protein
VTPHIHHIHLLSTIYIHEKKNRKRERMRSGDIVFYIYRLREKPRMWWMWGSQTTRVTDNKGHRRTRVTEGHR